VLVAALGPGLNLKGFDWDAHLAAEYKVESVRGAGGETGQQHFERCWAYTRDGGVIHLQEVFANLDVDAHFSTVKGANG
jgi:hypothetical protein